LLKGVIRDWKYLEREAWKELTNEHVASKSSSTEFGRQQTLIALLNSLPSFSVNLFFVGAKALIAELRDKSTEHVREESYP
jgi:hypothetical protein